MKRLLLVLLLLVLAFPAFAKDVTLSWDASPSEVDGYKIYYSSAPDIVSGEVKIITAGKVLSHQIAGLDNAGEQYFAVTGYDDTGNESEFSNIVMSPICTQPAAPNTSIESRCTSIHINIGQ